MLGILQYLDPPLPDPGPWPSPNRVRTGEVVFVMHNEDVKAVFKRISAIEGVEIVSEPHISEVPKDDGGVFRVLGMTGLSAWAGFMQRGFPKAGDRVVVSGAAGGVGSLVVQMARIQGCEVIGIAGGAEKCEFIRQLGCEHAIDY